MKRNFIFIRHAVIATIAGMLVVPTLLQAQDTYSWNDLVDWNGVTHWTKYMVMSPGKMGPNALPVPEIRTGLLTSDSKFVTAAEMHSIKGDITENLYLGYDQILPGNRASVCFFMVPVEYYQLDREMRNSRLCRSADPHGIAAGDLYFGTDIQLLKDKPGTPDILFGMYCRTASGGSLGNARFTDTPGYYFDFSFGKDFRKDTLQNSKLRWYAMFGFYCWQTNLNDYPQNDAPMIGAGIKYQRKSLSINNSISGYFGYIGAKKYVVVKDSDKPVTYSGDIPFVYRLDIEKSSGKYIYGIRFQQGIHDDWYSSVRISLSFLII